MLEPELWVISDRSDTIRFDDRWVLGLEGLNRLCRHVIKTFVERAPTDIDREFNYRDHLPGIVKGSLAPQLWIGNSEGFTPDQGPRFLEGLLQLLLPVMAGEPGAELIDIRGILEKIERALPGEQRPEARRPMIAIYVLWHRLLAAKHHRPGARRVIERFAGDLNAPSMVGFAVRLLLGENIEWSDDELTELVEARRRELQRGRGQKLPDRFDAALILCLARRRWDEEPDEARTLLSETVECLPGDEALMQLEEAARSGETPEVDLRGFVVNAHDEGPDSHEAVVPDGTEEANSEGMSDEVPDDPTKNPRDDKK